MIDYISKIVNVYTHQSKALPVVNEYNFLPWITLKF